MTMRELQDEARAWRERNFPKPEHRNGESQLIGMMEELGELSHAQLKGLQVIREYADLFDRDQARASLLLAKRDAVGDIVIFLTGYCDAEGIDLELAVENTWDKVKKRDWIDNPKTGETPLGQGPQG